MRLKGWGREGVREGINWEEMQAPVRAVGDWSEIALLKADLERGNTSTAMSRANYGADVSQCWFGWPSGWKSWRFASSVPRLLYAVADGAIWSPTPCLDTRPGRPASSLFQTAFCARGSGAWPNTASMFLASI